MSLTSSLCVLYSFSEWGFCGRGLFQNVGVSLHRVTGLVGGYYNIGVFFSKVRYLSYYHFFFLLFEGKF